MSGKPVPEEIRAAREVAELTQAQAAALVHCSPRAFEQWEAGERGMHPAFWELFRIKAGLSSTPLATVNKKA